jgi:hypothetical protein
VFSIGTTCRLTWTFPDFHAIDRPTCVHFDATPFCRTSERFLSTKSSATAHGIGSALRACFLPPLAEHRARYDLWSADGPGRREAVSRGPACRGWTQDGMQTNTKFQAQAQIPSPNTVDVTNGSGRLELRERRRVRPQIHVDLVEPDDRCSQLPKPLPHFRQPATKA